MYVHIHHTNMRYESITYTGTYIWRNTYVYTFLYNKCMYDMYVA